MNHYSFSFTKRKGLNLKRKKKEDLRHNPKSFFAYTKSLKKSNSFPMVMHKNNTTYDNPRDIANEIAKHFSSVYSDACTYDTLNCNGNCQNYFPLTTDTIKTIILSLDQNKANSPDGIPVVFYKNTIDTIINPLYLLFQLALSNMKYPDK